MRNARKIAALVAPLLLGACAAGPDYHRPDPQVAATGAFVTRAATFDQAQPLPDQWWRIYNDPALDTLVEQALTANTDLRVAAANLRKAQAALQEQRAGRLPSTTLSGGTSYGDGSAIGPVGAGGNTQWSENARLAVSWEVDLFGRVSRAIAAARADAAAVEAARDAVRVTVAAETTRAYVDACAYSYALDVARSSLKTSGESLRLVTEQERAGSASGLDVQRAEAAAANARAAIPSLEAQRESALFELAALLGRTPSGVPDAASQCVKPPEPTVALPVGDGAALLRRRPDLRQAERQFAADTARIGVATAELYPTISLGGSGNFFRNDTVKGSDSLSFSVGPLLSWSFPNIATARARLRQAEAQGDASLAAFDGRVIAALKEVEQAMTAVARGGERLAALRDAQDASDKAFRMADLKYRAGSLSYLEVLVAQNDLLSARAAYASAVQQTSSARVDLFKALGGGWQSAPPIAERAVAGDPVR